MSQSNEKRARRAWRKRMDKIARNDWTLYIKTIKQKLNRRKWAIIILSVICAVLIITLTVVLGSVYGY